MTYVFEIRTNTNIVKGMFRRLEYIVRIDEKRSTEQKNKASVTGEVGKGRPRQRKGRSRVSLTDQRL